MHGVTDRVIKEHVGVEAIRLLLRAKTGDPAHAHGLTIIDKRQGDVGIGISALEAKVRTGSAADGIKISVSARRDGVTHLLGIVLDPAAERDILQLHADGAELWAQPGVYIDGDAAAISANRQGMAALDARFEAIIAAGPVTGMFVSGTLRSRSSCRITP